MGLRKFTARARKAYKDKENLAFPPVFASFFVFALKNSSFRIL
jgi:hypothetical protein